MSESSKTITVCLGAASLNQTPFDWTGNRDRAIAAIDQAREQGVSLLTLPELAISAYGCEDMFYAEHVSRDSLASLAMLAPSTAGMVVAIGLPLLVELDGNRSLFNAAAILADGEVVGFYCKQFLADDGIHYEPRWFTPWPPGEVVTIDFFGKQLPVGDLLFDWGPVRFGLEVCRDAWVANRPAHRLATEGVRLIINPSASHFAFGKQLIRQHLAREGSKIVNGVYTYANLLGNESGRSIYDGGTIIASQGEIVAEGDPFSYSNHQLTTAIVSLPTTPGVPPNELRRIVLAISPKPNDKSKLSSPVNLELSKEEEFSRAVPLGLFDYLRKSCSQGFVVSLSGGADSAAVVVLVSLMVYRALNQLGVEGLAIRLGLTEKLAGAATAEEITKRILITVYQATKNSTETTRQAAEGVALAVGSEHYAWEIDELVAGYVSRVSKAEGRELSWKQDDLALQNIQARVRAPGVWMLANLHNALLLTTGNRSEASVGYMTMDGDTAGGLAPIAGLDKAYLREWLGWIEKHAPDSCESYPALKAVNVQQPTAELRPDQHNPSGKKQTDEADLMPYEVLDVVERSAIGDLQTPDQTLAALSARFTEYETAQLEAWVSKFWRLWKTSQWKRERLAPSFHLDTLSVDPKTWRRYPILSHVD